jgi:hypothetical protein
MDLVGLWDGIATTTHTEEDVPREGAGTPDNDK